MVQGPILLYARNLRLVSTTRIVSCSYIVLPTSLVEDIKKMSQDYESYFKSQ